MEERGLSGGSEWSGGGLCGESWEGGWKSVGVVWRGRRVAGYGGGLQVGEWMVVVS